MSSVSKLLRIQDTHSQHMALQLDALSLVNYVAAWWKPVATNP